MSQPSFDPASESDEPDVVEFTEEMSEEVWAEDTSGPGLVPRMLAELAGTFILVFMGVGAALFSGVLGWDGINVAFGFALGVIIAALIFGGISGAHLNPAVTVGVWLAGRFPGRDVAPYVLAQLVGATTAGGVFYLLRSTNELYDQLGTASEFMATAANGYADYSPTQFDWLAGGIVEVIIAALLVAVVLSMTSARAVPGFAPFGIGLTVGFLVLIAIPFTNGALNPARATGIALFSGTEHIQQLWLFWLAPLIGAAITGLLFRAFGPEEDLVTVEVIETIDSQ
ncbi:aquaporin [Demequina sp. SYSU T00192]|uniref:Aquaporin n=1 Tax=Demequina litoralis TaxID=3051660 RepID=A0ABT8G754_9MICO|nr:aquaporin [Demequina sp. SYSU T00192]MDN4474976.1 aquaporin [Demequina sp. SYSU T00192]